MNQAHIMEMASAIDTALLSREILTTKPFGYLLADRFAVFHPIAYVFFLKQTDNGEDVVALMGTRVIGSKIFDRFVPFYNGHINKDALCAYLDMSEDFVNELMHCRFRDNAVRLAITIRCKLLLTLKEFTSEAKTKARYI